MKLLSRQMTTLKPTLSLLDAIALIVGLVIGAGIFETPALVAANAGSATVALLTWVLGGVLSLIGALCYAELATAYPHPGGNYYYLRRAFGRAIAFLFAWTRLSVIQTGSIALLAFVFGDYASQLWRLGTYSASIYAAIAIVIFTGLNILGVQQGKWVQNVLAVAQVAGLLIVSGIGLAFSFGATSGVPIDPATYTSVQASITAQASLPASSNLGIILVFVLLTYGGWNEAAYISTEVRNGQRNIVLALVWSIAIITGVYLLINWALVRELGLVRMAASEAVVAELMRSTVGIVGVVLISGLVAIATLCSINATIFTGARTNYALGRDFSIFSLLGRGRESNPTNALLVQSAIALLLVLVGSITRQGFETMVDYTAPAFWFFFLLSGISLFVLRRREPDVERSFKVPLYPLTPLLFCGICLYMLQASLAYTGWGGLLGVVVLLLGLPLLWWTNRTSSSQR
ncbi:putative amino acid transporter (plasmid) [Leptolyngbya boryana NIES-2135]|uniref:Putative amino acid transporter n=2 Tax=Leptolyngbya group TaxID=3081713 RepID=A0A1Z4JR48_LEPBY|nr:MULTISPECIES: amino acid permease [Leptolyngbya]BAY59184.1 putative amino acid transporter [Leptolyngbya boryana NIES-2135]